MKTGCSLQSELSYILGISFTFQYCISLCVALPRACSPGDSGRTHLTLPIPSSPLREQSPYCAFLIELAIMDVGLACYLI